jgi:hypothetical protein
MKLGLGNFGGYRTLVIRLIFGGYFFHSSLSFFLVPEKRLATNGEFVNDRIYGTFLG